MRDNGTGALLDGFRDEDLASLLEEDSQGATAIDIHLTLNNLSTSFFNNFIG
jgi:hypothetical protein